MTHTAAPWVTPDAQIVGGSGRPHYVQTITHVLAKLTQEWGQYFPGASAPPMVLSVRYRPRRLSDIAKAVLVTGATAVTIYIKIHKHYVSTPERVKEKARLEFETLRHLHGAMAGISGCAVPRPLAYFPEEIALVTEEVPGHNLYQLIKSTLRPYARVANRRAVEAHCAASGLWLRHFQEVTRQGTRTSPQEAGVLPGLARDLELCVSKGLPPDDSFRLVGLCEDRLAKLEGLTFPLVGSHPDFQPDNVVANTHGVSVLDFTSFRYNLPSSDVGRFVATVEFFGKHPLYDHRRIAALRVAFLRGYGMKGTEADAVLVYVVRYLVKAVLAVATWPAPSLVRWLRERRAVAFLSAWSRRAVSGGHDVLLPG